MVDIYNGVIYNSGNFSQVADAISIEVALSIAVNGVPFTVTMQTPGNEIELARGLLYTENIFTEPSIFPEVEIVSRNQEGYITALNMVVDSRYIIKDFANTRNVISASSCGICGKTEIDEFHGIKINVSEKLEADLIPKMFEQISRGQSDFKQSGGTHAAGAFDIDGHMLTMQEDIGRHNAVDKVIGYLIINRLLSEAKCITVSGRISFEIVNKTRLARIPFLAAVSAPSSLAIENAEEAGITLMAFCRNTKFTIYSNPQNVAMGNESFVSGKIKTKLQDVE